MLHPNLRHLEIFRTLLQNLSVTETARLLNVTQPAVSKAMAQLEERVGFRLFNRMQGRLHPSADALRLLAEVERVLNQVAQLNDEIEALQDAWHGRLSLATIPSLAIGSVANSVGVFARTHPKVRVEFRSDMSSRIVQDVARHNIELGYIHGKPQEAAVESEVVAESEVACLLRRDHRLAKAEFLTAKDLSGESLIFLDPESPPNHLIRESFAAALVHPHVTMEINASALAHEVVRHTGVAFIDPMAIARKTSPDLVIKRYVPRIPLRIYAVFSAYRPISNIASRFRVLAEQQIAKSILQSFEDAER